MRLDVLRRGIYCLLTSHPISPGGRAHATPGCQGRPSPLKGFRRECPIQIAVSLSPSFLGRSCLSTHIDNLCPSRTSCLGTHLCSKLRLLVFVLWSHCNHVKHSLPYICNACLSKICVVKETRPDFFSVEREGALGTQEYVEPQNPHTPTCVLLFGHAEMSGAHSSAAGLTQKAIVGDFFFYELSLQSCGWQRCCGTIGSANSTASTVCKQDFAANGPHFEDQDL